MEVDAPALGEEGVPTLLALVPVKYADKLGF
jgi:hypothetical protein